MEPTYLFRKRPWDQDPAIECRVGERTPCYDGHHRHVFPGMVVQLRCKLISIDCERWFVSSKVAYCEFVEWMFRSSHGKSLDEKLQSQRLVAAVNQSIQPNLIFSNYIKQFTISLFENKICVFQTKGKVGGSLWMAYQMIIWQIFQGDVSVSSTKNLFWSEGRGTKCRPKFSTHPFFMPLLKDSFSHSSIHSCTHSFIYSLIHSVIHLFRY